MNLADITTKCYILALIIRDDGERLLLGDGAYEFKDSQQHFIANTYANDVVELQGTDGQMLAGQVRRTATQTFAGYIGDATFSKQKVEEARRDFLMFFRKKHYYTAVYVFSDGTAIQRDRGYIVNAPSAPELYQRFPEWSVGLNFEDPNYYEYAEDDLGHEIAAHKVELELSTAMSGGLIWDGDGAVSDDLSYVGTEIEGEGKNFQLADTGTATLKSAELLGNAEQTTYSGKNKLPMIDGTATIRGITATISDGVLTLNGTSTGSGILKLTNGVEGAESLAPSETWLTETFPITNLNGTNIAIDYQSGTSPQASSAFRIYGPTTTYINQWYPLTTNQAAAWSSDTQAPSCLCFFFGNGTTFNNYKVTLQIESGSTATSFEKFVGGTPAPNPDYPQEVNTVTGEQVVKIEGKNLFDYASASDTANTFVSTYRLFKLEGLLPNTQYTLSGMTFSSTSDMTGKYLYIWSGDAYATREPSVFIADGGNISSSKTFTTSGTGSYYLAVYPTDATTWSSVLGFLQNAQLELGQATTYEPYQGQTLPVNLGKNLFDGIIEQGGFDVSGLNVGAGNRVRSTNYIPVQPNTKYTIKGFSWDTTKGAVLGASISYYSVNDYTTARLSYQNWVSIGVEQGFTLTTPANCHYIRFLLTVGATAGGTTAVTPADVGEIQVELGSKATSFAPFLVTKNLLPIPNPYALTGIKTYDITLSPGTYTLSLAGATTTGSSQASYFRVFDDNNTDLATNTVSFSSANSWTFTLSSTATKFAIYSQNTYAGSSGVTTTFRDLMLEQGGTKTPYEPYGAPYELAKIGTHQDRIYKQNGTWYIEKQVGKVVLDGTELGWGAGSGTAGFLLFYDANSPFVPMAKGTPSYQSLCDHFTVQPTSTTWTGAGKCGFNSLGTFWLMMTDTSMTSVADFKTWLGSNNTTLYFPLATPTTTEITNSELVGQLERLRHSHTYADTTNFSITATSPNLPAFLKVVAFGDDAIPQGGYVWEDGGAGGATTITVDGVDNAQPIWTVVGPATNPSLTNITTGESIQWTGVVPNGQTLVVNMADMTASLSGANVFEFISGSWITLQAGNNRVSYSATAATGIATLEWNGVVG